LPPRQGHDAADTPPDTGLTGVRIQTSEYTGTTRDPYLEVTYPTASSLEYTPAIQNITYTYDAVGNITNITDLSDTGADKTVNFTYDHLNHLTWALLTWL
jgi:hypothetical protein